MSIDRYSHHHARVADADLRAAVLLICEEHEKSKAHQRDRHVIDYIEHVYRKRGQGNQLKNYQSFHPEQILDIGIDY